MLPAIAVFAKAPVPGRVKTRLASKIGAEQATRVYEQMVSVLLQRLAEAANRLDCSIELHTDAESDAWNGSAVTRRLQASGDLGARMLNALETGLSEGRTRVLILGGDVPTVPISHLEELLAADADVALGPAEDGGFWGISCRKTDAAMFAGVTWSTAGVCEETVDACRRAGLSVSIGSEWFDIDEPSDLERI